jgi:hypothetical protein
VERASGLERRTPWSLRSERLDPARDDDVSRFEHGKLAVVKPVGGE